MAATPQLLEYPGLDVPQSLFFALPLEIRNIIYTLVLGISKQELHLSRRNRKFQLSVCAGPDDDWRSKRELDGTNNSNGTCSRRLMSEWGSHWKCEEPILDPPEKGVLRCIFLPIFQTCKQIFFECSDCICRSITLHISNLQTANIFLRSSRNVLHAARSLSLTFFLPLSFYQAAEGFRDSKFLPIREEGRWDGIGVGEEGEWLQEVQFWAEMWTMVFDLRHLQTLEVWLDHSGSVKTFGNGGSFELPEWAIIHERHLLPSFPVGQVETSPRVYLTLPLLAVGMKDPDRHFLEFPPSSQIFLSRRKRQVFFGVEWQVIRTEPGTNTSWRSLSMDDDLSYIHEEPYELLMLDL